MEGVYAFHTHFIRNVHTIALVQDDALGPGPAKTSNAGGYYRRRDRSSCTRGGDLSGTPNENFAHEAGSDGSIRLIANMRSLGRFLQGFARISSCSRSSACSCSLSGFAA